ncbi:MAG: hypothetical protein V3T05_01965 [Myxococcota bacterium]
MQRGPETLTLTEEDLAFYRLSCDLFPALESPLRFLDEEDIEPDDVEAAVGSLEERGLLNPTGSGASQDVLDRLTPVSECSARVTLTVHGPVSTTRDFYLAADGGVEYRCDGAAHTFGPLRNETALAVELAQHFKPAAEPAPRGVRLSASDYLVFAVFARDVRQSSEPTNGEAPMSVDEVLSYFDEAETKVVRTPSDETWVTSIATLTSSGVLVESKNGYTMHPNLHAVAREIVADHEHTVTRFDFLDEHWLMREVSLYPTGEAVYRLGTEPDGAVLIEELSIASLADVLASVVGTLPNLLNPEAPPSFRHPKMGGRVPF